MGSITKTLLFKYIENFTSKNWKFSDEKKNWYFFHISAQNIDCECSLEPPRWGGSNDYSQSMFLNRNKNNNVYLFKPQFSEFESVTVNEPSVIDWKKIYCVCMMVISLALVAGFLIVSHYAIKSYDSYGDIIK